MRSRVAPAVALAAVWLVATTVGPTAIDTPSDLPVYRSYAEALRVGLLPYRDFALEYPPLALVPIGLGGALGVGEATYAAVFGGLMLVAALVVQREAALLGGPRAAWLMVALPVALGALVRTRFDLVPTALAVAGIATLLVRARPRAAFALLAVGAATKLWPVVPAAVALAWLLGRGERRVALGGLAAFAAVLAAVWLPFAALSPAGFAEQFDFHLERPVQIESAPATVLWVLGGSEVTGAPVRPDRFRSNGLAGGPADVVAAGFAGLQLLALAAAIALAARGGGRDRLLLACLAGVLAFVALGKVLSPQFLIWVAPFAAVSAARLPALLALAAVPLTQVEFPARYFDLVEGDAAVVAIVGVRNGLLLAALSLALARLAAPVRSRPPGAAAARSG